MAEDDLIENSKNRLETDLKRSSNTTQNIFYPDKAVSVVFLDYMENKSEPAYGIHTISEDVLLPLFKCPYIKFVHHSIEGYKNDVGENHYDGLIIHPKLEALEKENERIKDLNWMLRQTLPFPKYIAVTGQDKIDFLSKEYHDQPSVRCGPMLPQPMLQFCRKLHENEYRTKELNSWIKQYPFKYPWLK